MKKTMNFAFVLVILLLGMNFASAEINMWTDTYVNQNASIVNMYALVNLFDTSTDLITISKPVPIIINYNTQNLPYNISFYHPEFSNAYVDYCNLTIKHEENVFDGTTGRITNYTTTIDSFYFTNQTYGAVQYRMHHEDVLSVSMSCHYTNPETLFIDSLYFGQYSIFFPAYECAGCEKYSFEQLSQENEKFNEKVTEELSIYTSIQKVVQKNYELWQIFKWILRIGLLVGAVGLIFAVMYFFYVYIKKMAGVQ